MSNNPLPYRHIQEQTERQLLNIMVDKLCCISENTTANNEYKIAYYQEISSSTGTITVPTGATILLNQLAGGADALVSTIDGVPTGSFPQTSGGVQVDVTSFDSSGNYVLSGTPSSYPVALIYWLKISAADYPNLDIDNIIEENIPLLVDNIYTADGTLTGDRTVNLDTYDLNFTSGNVGIGTTSPSASLHIIGDEQCNLIVESTVTGSGIDFVDNTTSDYNQVGIGALGDNLCFRSGGVAAGNMRLTDAGDLGIGTTSPSARLHADNTDTSGVAAIFENSNVSNTDDLAQFHNSTGEVASITNEGYIKAQATTSTSDTVAVWDGDTLKKKVMTNKTIFTSNPADGVAPSSTEQISPVGSNSFNTLNRNFIVVPANGEISNFYILTQSTQPADGDLVITLQVNFVNTAMSITVPANSTSALWSDLATTVSVSAGDIILFSATNASASNSAKVITTSLTFTFD